MKNTKQAGFGVLGVLVVLVIIAVLAFGGWLVWQKNHDKKDDNKTKTSQSTSSNNTKKEEAKEQPAKSDEQLIKEALLKDCRDVVAPAWAKEAGKTVNPDSVTMVIGKDRDGNERKIIINGNYARASSGCNTPELSDGERTAGTITFLQKVNGTWGVYSKDQQPPLCSKFDNKGWPADVVPSCYEEDGTSRQIKP